jgi:hypothetical protein
MQFSFRLSLNLPLITPKDSNTPYGQARRQNGLYRNIDMLNIAKKAQKKTDAVSRWKKSLTPRYLSSPVENATASITNAMENIRRKAMVIALFEIFSFFDGRR